MASNLYDSMAAMQVILQDALVDEFPQTSIKIAKVDPDRPWRFPGLPGILIMEVGSERATREGTNERDDIGYPIAVIVFDNDRGDGTGTPNTTGTQDQNLLHAKRLEWRETIRRKLRHKAAALRTNGGPVCAYDIECIPQEIVAPEKWRKRNLWASAQVFIVWSRETRL